MGYFGRFLEVCMVAWQCPKSHCAAHLCPSRRQLGQIAQNSTWVTTSRLLQFTYLVITRYSTCPSRPTDQMNHVACWNGTATCRESG